MKLSIRSFNAKSVALGGILLAAVMTTPVYAGEHHKGYKHERPTVGMHEHKFGRHLSNALSLTEEQQQALKSHREAQSEARRGLHKQTREAEKALISAVNAGASDNELQALANELGKLKASVALERAKSHKAFLAVLTPEQQQKLEELKAGHKGKFKEWRGKHHERRGLSS